MAFVRSVPHSSYWLAVFVDERGRKTNRSTKLKATPGNRAKALRMAMEWERASKASKAGELTAAAAAKSLARMVEASSGETMKNDSAAEMCTAWLKGREGKLSKSSLARYKPVITAFLASLGPRAHKSLRGIVPGDVERFQREMVAGGRTAGTANFGVKVLRILFRQSHVRGVIPINPAAAVELLEDDAKVKDPFTVEDIGKLLAAASDDWRGVILFGALAGLRLADAANLRWSGVNLKERSLSYLPQKTAKRRKGVPLVVALHPDILAWLATRPAPPDADAPIFPVLIGKRTGNWAGLSNAFASLMKEAGIVSAPTRGSRRGGRAFHPLSFHSLRHSFVSELLNRSVPADVRKMIAGHSCDRAHAAYSHLSLETQRAAVETHPGFREAEAQPGGEAGKGESVPGQIPGQDQNGEEAQPGGEAGGAAEIQ